jgi:hypothetical protein
MEEHLEKENGNFLSYTSYIVTCLNMTTNRVWIGNWIYWALKDTTCDYTLQIIIRQRLVFSVMVFTALLVVASNGVSFSASVSKELLSSRAGTFHLQLPS